MKRELFNGIRLFVLLLPFDFVSSQDFIVFSPMQKVTTSFHLSIFSLNLLETTGYHQYGAGNGLSNNGNGNTEKWDIRNLRRHGNNS